MMDYSIANLRFVNMPSFRVIYEEFKISAMPVTFIL